MEQINIQRRDATPRFRAESDHFINILASSASSLKQSEEALSNQTSQHLQLK